MKDKAFSPLETIRKQGRDRVSLTGFSLIELIIAIVLLGLIMIPLGFMSMEFTRAIIYSRNLSTAYALAGREMAKVNNLSYSDSTLAIGYDNTVSNYEGFPFDLRRSVSDGPLGSLKKVQVRLFPPGESTGPIVNLITYISDIAFGSAASGGAVGTTDKAELLVSGGSISGKQLRNVSLENTSHSSITITGAIVSFTGGPGAVKMTNITINGIQRWSGNESSGSTVNFSNNFVMNPDTVYNNTAFFDFNKNLSSVSVIFIMKDGSQSSTYSW